MSLNVSTMTREQLEALVAKMTLDSQRKVTLKVTEPKLDPKTGEMKGSTGAIAMYGIGRFPITLYRSQWERVIEAIKSGQVDRFIEANADKLSVKD